MATAPPAWTSPAARFAKDHLRAFVERVERLEEEKKAISDDIRDVFAEAKANGFDVKALRSRPAAQAGQQRAPRAGSDPGDLSARARHAGMRPLFPAQRTYQTAAKKRETGSPASANSATRCGACDPRRFTFVGDAACPLSAGWR